MDECREAQVWYKRIHELYFELISSGIESEGQNTKPKREWTVDTALDGEEYEEINEWRYTFPTSPTCLEWKNDNNKWGKRMQIIKGM